MKVVCLVPSWTETLIEAGVDVVGRTRFCIHPKDKVKNSAIVGGTKSINIKKIILLKPDVVILDKEENTIEIYELLKANNLKCLVTHVVDMASVARDLKILAHFFENNVYLKKWSDDYCNIINSTNIKLKIFNNSHLKISYVIWKNPWMCVSKNTFIGSVLENLGVNLDLNQKKYYEISDRELKKTYCLFSTEPFPFQKEILKLNEKGFLGEMIDGESISWFGIRNLKFMKSVQVQKK